MINQADEIMNESEWSRSTAVIGGKTVTVYQNKPNPPRINYHIFAFAVRPLIEEFYSSPENVAKYEAWLKEKKKRRENGQLNGDGESHVGK